MTDDKLIAIANDYGRYWPEIPIARGPTQKIWSEWTYEEQRGHLRWMCAQIPEFVRDDRRHKAMRWLGFVQGAMCVLGVWAIDKLKEDNRPDEPADPLPA